MPFKDAEAAVAHLATAYGLPFCPQLPRLEGDMVTEWLGADPDRCGWSPQRDRERPQAWDPFLAKLRHQPPQHRLAKLQVTGPATLACALERRQTGRPSRRGALNLSSEIAQWLAANVTGQVDRLAESGIDTVLVVDEPALAVFGVGGVELAWEPLARVAPAWGIHLCCHVPWQLVERAEPDLLSFDLALDSVDAQAAAALARQLERGGWIAWGALRVDPGDYASQAVHRLDKALGRINADSSRSLVTASCGSGRMSVAREREIAISLHNTSAAMRRRQQRSERDAPKSHDQEVPGRGAQASRSAKTWCGLRG